MELKIIRKAFQPSNTVETAAKDSLENDSMENISIESDDVPTENRDLVENDEVNRKPYTISFVDGILSLGVITKYRDKDFNGSIDLDVADNTYKIFDIVLYENMDSVGLSAYEVFNYVHKDSGLRNRQFDGQKIARVLIDDNIVWLWLCLATDEIEGFENEVYDGEKSTTGMLQEKSEWFRNRVLLFKKKAKMLNGVDIYKSLAYLEAQVDLLTRIVLGDNDGSLLAALKLADDNSVLNMKPLEDVKAEFTVGKRALREAQEAYYVNLKE